MLESLTPITLVWSASDEFFGKSGQRHIEFFISARNPLPVSDYYEIHTLTRPQLGLVTRAAGGNLVAGRGISTKGSGAARAACSTCHSIFD